MSLEIHVSAVLGLLSQLLLYKLQATTLGPLKAGVEFPGRCTIFIFQLPIKKV